MPVNEIVTTLKAGEAVTVMGPGTLEFQAPKIAAAAAKMAGGTAVGTKGVAAAGGAAAMGNTTVFGAGQIASTTASGGAASSIPASLMSGKVLGLSLGTMNPWFLLGVGALSGYYYCKKRRFSFF